ncbi:MAG: UDP-glucose 4-epimerase GalE [Bacteroidales bacterium]|nr:MAG: UDP-glucose 4-epimerase GalE [Bacteroidales bacterium]
MKKFVLVTGGTGYIGSHTAVELIEEGFEVVIVDNLVNSSIEVLDGIEQITGIRPHFEKFDLCDSIKIDELCKKYPRLEVIVHFAALKAVGESVEIPLDYYYNNLVSSINLLRAMIDYNIPNMVFSSSAAVYGLPDKLPVTEDSPVKKANSPYGNTKQIIEEIILDTINVNSNLEAISLRYFNPIGAHKSALIGELPLGVPLNLVPYVTQTAIGIRDHLRVFGNDYNTPDGTGVRDYINVVDLSRAHVSAIKRLLDKKCKSNYEVFNLGTGKGLSVMEIVKSFEKATGQKIKYKIYPRRPGDIDIVYADTSYSNRELGWKAEISLEETLLSAWNWEKNIRKKS